MIEYKNKMSLYRYRQNERSWRNGTGILLCPWSSTATTYGHPCALLYVGAGHSGSESAQYAEARGVTRLVWPMMSRTKSEIPQMRLTVRLAKDLVVVSSNVETKYFGAEHK